MHNLQTSVFTNFVNYQGNGSLEKVLLTIKDDTYQVQIEKIRKLNGEGKKVAADKLKQKLPAFTPSGVFAKGRKLDLLEEYVPVIGLDFDNVNGSLGDLIQKVNTLPTTYCSFISPRGNGLKVLVITNCNQDKHTQAFNQVADFYEKETGIKSDRSVKDIPRLCFISYDPDLYLNPESQVFELQAADEDMEPDTHQDTDYEDLFNDCVTFSEKKGNYHNGDRNNFIYRLACNCNRNGIPVQQTMDFCLPKYDLGQAEIRSTIKSAYQKYQHQFETYTNSKDSRKGSKEGPTDDSFLKNSPNIPDEMYALMPELIKKGVQAFTDKREKDVFFTGALSILSGCLPNVEGVYAQQTVYPNVFCFIIAPPASGKRALKFARTLGEVTQEMMLFESEEAMRTFNRLTREYNHRQRQRNANTDEEPPEAPPFKILFIPANSSYAKILDHLQQNNGSGIICETEADTMGNILKQEWGNYSDFLRKVFHHEPVSSSRKTNGVYIEITNPRVSVAITGTPGQIANLIASAEDGLFSRFFFYIFKADQIWQDVSPNVDGLNLTEHFRNISGEVNNMVTFLEANQTRFFLTSDQWDLLNESFSDMLTEVAVFTSENAGSIVKRMGLLLYRIAMIFSAIRKFEANNTTEEIYCTDADFLNALHLTELYLKHSLIMYQNLPKEDDHLTFKEAPNKRAFFDALPSTFKRSDAIKLGPDYGLSNRTVDGFLKKLLNSHLNKVANGQYAKR